MLDENLPAFFLKPSPTGAKHLSSIHLSHHGSDPEPVYNLNYLDPASTTPAHKNCYAAALFDAFIPDVLFGEVLARPTWTQPSLSQEEIRRNGGIPPPPQAQVPNEFAIQLYNPDQQVSVHLKEGKWGASDSYEFSLPETTFRTPSASSLDRGQSDPGSLDITPRINFAWRRESKLSKELTCFMTGKSTDKEKKKSRRDPDIAIALWRSMRELTVYESNLSRIDIEDPKGLEVTLLLSAIVIKDLWFSSKDRVSDLFNVTEGGVRKLSSGGRKISNPQAPQGVLVAPQQTPQARVSSNDLRRDALPKIQTTPPGSRQPALPASHPPPPPPDPRTQWEIDAETARLRHVADAEAREVQRQRREREKAEEAERKRLQKVFESEQKDARRRAEEIEKETQRLRKIYGLEGQTLRPEANTSQQRHDNPRRSFQGELQRPAQRLGSNGLPYSSAAASSSSGGAVMSGANPNASMLSVASSLKPQEARRKKSFFGMRSNEDVSGQDQRNRLAKKQSSVW